MSVKNDLRRMAMEEVLIIEPADVATISQEGETEDLLSTLAPAERAKVLTLAARRLAFQILFELDSRRAADPSEAEAILSRVRGIEPKLSTHVLAIVSGAYDRRRDADAAVEKIAPEWPSHRQATVDRAILRLAYFEMVGTETHARIVINEAVEIAKSFSAEKAPAFINGVLDKIMKSIAAEGAAPVEQVAPDEEHPANEPTETGTSQPIEGAP